MSIKSPQMPDLVRPDADRFHVGRVEVPFTTPADGEITITWGNLRRLVKEACATGWNLHCREVVDLQASMTREIGT